MLPICILCVAHEEQCCKFQNLEMSKPFMIQETDVSKQNLLRLLGKI